MAGKTAIDTDLRNDIVTFLASVVDDKDLGGPGGIKQRANELYWSLRPQRTRLRKAGTVTEEAAGSDIQSSQ